MAIRSATVKNGQAWGFGFGCDSGGGGTGAAFGSALGRLARQAGMPAPSGRVLALGRACSRAGLGDGFSALWLWKLWKMLYVGPCPSRGRCIPRSLFACSGRLVVRGLRVRSVSVGQDIRRSACDVPCLRM